MKRIKKVISLILCFCMMFGFTLEAFAACVTPSTDKVSVAAGQSVTVTLTLDEDILNCISFEYYLYYDADKFTMTEAKAGEDNPKIVIPDRVYSDNEGTYCKINYLDTISKGDTIHTGTLCEVTFTAKDDISASEEVTFRARRMEIFDNTMNDVGADAVTTGDPVKVTVTPAPAAAYQVDLEAPQTVQVGETAPVKVKISSENAAVYNAFDVTLNYDKEKLELATDSLGEGYTVNNNVPGVVRVTCFGADQQLGDAFTLNFTALQTGKAEVEFGSAKVDKADHAINDDAPEAAKGTDKVTITIGGYMVTLSDDFEGDSVTTPGKDYTFTVRNPHYDYDVVAKIGDTKLTVTDNGNGSYTISKDQINGNITVTATKTAKQYDVTVTGNGAADVAAPEKATYGTAYIYTLTQDSKYAYTVTITVDGTEITPELQAGTADQYKIAGDQITGPMEINVAKVQTAGTVTFEGEGAADVEGEKVQNAMINQPFTFKINKVKDFTYTVTAVKGENTITVTDNEDGTYTIAAADITGENITVNVAKIPTKTIEVSQYVKLNGKVMYLIVANDSSLTAEKVLTYNGTPMYWSDKYDGYCWLVISDKTQDEVKEETMPLLGSLDGTKTEITYEGDVNKTGQIDINDAQLVYDMYKPVYDGFDTVSVEKFLRADMNGTKNLDVEDVTAVISVILN